MNDELALRAAAYATAVANTNAAKAQVELARRMHQKAVGMLADARGREEAAAEALLTGAAGGNA